MLTLQQFLDVLDLGHASTLIDLIKAVRDAATTTDGDENLGLVQAITLVDRLSTYKKPLAFSFPVGTLDAFMAQYIGKVDEDRKVYYAALSFLWRADLTHVKQTLLKRQGQIS